MELGRGRNLETMIAGIDGLVAESVLSTHAAAGFARSMGDLERPILEPMQAILQHGKEPSEAIREWMNRPLTQPSARYRI